MPLLLDTNLDDDGYTEAANARKKHKSPASRSPAATRGVPLSCVFDLDFFDNGKVLIASGHIDPWR